MSVAEIIDQPRPKLPTARTDPPLPATYTEAKAALERCERVDECAEWGRPRRSACQLCAAGPRARGDGEEDSRESDAPRRGAPPANPDLPWPALRSQTRSRRWSV